jgi:cytochrome b561
MQWLDGRNNYGWASIILHWTAAIVIITMYAIGTKFEGLPDGDAKLALFRLHLAIGVVAAPLLLTRILARVLHRGPRTLPQKQPYALIAAATQWGLLACVAVLIISGPISEFWSGRGLDTFGGLHVPSPLKQNEALAKAADAVHHAAATVIAPLFWLHLAGAAKHVFLDGDRTLLRMLWPAKD